MRTLRVLALTCAALTFIAACGGPAEDDEEDLATIEDASADPAKADTASQTAAPSTFNPLSSSSSQLTAAKRYATNPRYVGVHGTLAAVNRSTGARSYKWTVTLRGDNNIYVDLAVAPGTVRILKHESRQMLMGQGFFAKSDVKVTPSQLATKYATKKLKAMDLSEPVTAHPVPHWLVTFDDGSSRFVDAQTGSEQH